MTSTQRRISTVATCALSSVLAIRFAYSQAASTPPYLYSSALAINAHGQVAGVSFDENADVRATFWDRGIAVDLGVPEGESWANALNDAGEVVGYMKMPDGVSHAFSWKNGVLDDLGAGEPGGLGAFAVSINAGGQVAGLWGPSSGSSMHACLWDHGRFTDLGEAYISVRINDRGQVMWSTYAGHTFLWDHGVTQDLGVIPGGTASIAVDLNDRGQVTGIAYPQAGSNHAFVWDRGGMVDLGVDTRDFPDAIGSSPYAINARGQIVGIVQEPFPSYTAHAVLWEVRGASGQDGDSRARGGGAPTVVTTALDASYAVDINDRGQILAQDADGWMILKDGAKTRLPTHDDTSWTKLSEQGDVLGYRYITVPNSPATYYPIAVLWIDGQAMDLPGLDGAP